MGKQMGLGFWEGGRNELFKAMCQEYAQNMRRLRKALECAEDECEKQELLNQIKELQDSFHRKKREAKGHLF